METDFNVICEDGSPDEVGELLCVMWRQCSVGDFKLVQTTIAKEDAAINSIKHSQGLDCGDAIDSDDENEGVDVETVVNDDTASSEVQADTAMSEDVQEPIADPDGWTAVSKKGKKSSRK